MKPDTEKLMLAYLEVYGDFEDIYLKYIHRSEEVTALETAKLFEIALRDSLLGEVLKEKILQRYQEILEAEQAKQVAKEEAGEAMIV